MHAAGDRVGYAVRNCARLARSCSGKNDYRTRYTLGRSTLLVIEGIKDVWHPPIVAGSCDVRTVKVELQPEEFFHFSNAWVRAR